MRLHEGGIAPDLRKLDMTPLTHCSQLHLRCRLPEVCLLERNITVRLLAASVVCGMGCSVCMTQRWHFQKPTSISQDHVQSAGTVSNAVVSRAPLPEPSCGRSVCSRGLPGSERPQRCAYQSCRSVSSPASRASRQDKLEGPQCRDLHAACVRAPALTAHWNCRIALL
jgi:hypothetical protein